jgi:hypothetical protein
VLLLIKGNAILIQESFTLLGCMMNDNQSSEMKPVFEAITAIHETLRVKPDMAIARYDLAMLYLKTGQRSAAILQLRILDKYDESMAQKLAEQIFPKPSPDN